MSIVGVGLFVSACHGSDDSTGSQAAGGAGAGGSAGATTLSSATDLDGILAGEGRGYCARLFRCFEGNDDFVSSRLILETPASCEALLADINAKSPLIRDLRLQLSQGALQIVPAKAQACLDELAACNGIDSLSRGSCRDMFEGRVAPGAACQRSEDCAGDAFCDISSACPGVCSARKASGERCEYDGECTQGAGYTFCDRDLASGAACRTLPVSAKATLGQPCTRRLGGAETLALCVDSLWCAGVAGQPDAALGTCQPPIPAGGACSDNDDMCSEGLCDTSTSVCRSFSLLKKVADRCDKQNLLVCDPLLGLRCNAAGTCERSGDRTQGSICFNGDFQQSCNSGLYCQPGTAGGDATCQPLLETGAPCSLASSCESGACQGTCQARACSR